MNNVSPQPSLEAQELFLTTRLRISNVQAAQRIWDRSFNATDRKMLGSTFLKALELYPNAVRMWAKVKRVNRSLAVIEVAESLDLLSPQDADWLRREGGELPSDPAEAEMAAIARGDLVVSIKERSISWDGREYDIPFLNHPKLWDFFVTTCRAAKRGEGVGWDTFSSGKDDSYVAKTKSKLSTLPGFPIALIDLFVSDGVKRQRLDLPAERIYIVE